MSRPVGRRSAAVVGTMVAAVVGLAGCSKETVTPAPGAPVAYAAVGANEATPGDAVVPVATATGAVGRPIVVGTLPAAVAAVPGGAALLVAVKAENSLVEVSTATGKVERKVGVGLEPDAVAVTPDGSTALVADFGAATVTVVRLPSLTVAATVPVGRQPVALAVTPDGSRALVVDYGDGTVTPIGLPSLRPGPPVPVGPEPVAVAVAPAGTEALVADFQTGALLPVDLPSLVPGPPLPIGANPTGITIPAGSTVAWVSAGDGVTPVTLAGGVVGTPVAVHAPAQCIGAGPAGRAWVCSGRGALVEIDLATAKVVRTVATDGIPAAVVVTGPGSAP